LATELAIEIIKVDLLIQKSPLILINIGAENEVRTRDPQLGKLIMF
jgi:hypothetical protein